MQDFATRALFATTVFVAAALVFLVQPMVARELLPAFGGTPAVWNTTVVFFQVVLLAGYALAHVSLRLLSTRGQVLLQLALVALTVTFLPFAVGDRAREVPPDAVAPAAWIVVLLAAAVGVPYLTVSTASPVLQRWYASIGARDSADPYFLYAASNAGSLVGLLAFPVLLEPRLGTSSQQAVWALCFGVYVVLLAASSFVLLRRASHGARAATFAAAAAASASSPTHPPAGAPITRLQALRWVLLAALPAALMLGVTTYLTTDVASVPMLWVLPLSLYLVSFMVTFGRRVHVAPRPAGAAAAIATCALLLVELELVDASELARVLVHLAAMFTAAVAVHALLHSERPDASRLTAFYLLLSLGGALGGALVALVAPATLEGVYEYPLLLAAVLAARPVAWRGPDRLRESPPWRAALTLAELTLAGLLLAVLASAAADEGSLHERVDGNGWLITTIVLMLLLVLRRWGLVLAVTGAFVLMATAQGDDVIARDRSFWGTLRVERTDDQHRLLHGTTLHGAQFRDAARRDVPTTYYSEAGPVGDIFTRLQRDEPFVRVGAVGLGTGSLIGYARLWQRFTYYEIDPAVIRVARDPDLFTWLSDAQVDVKIVEGDARIRLREATDARYDLLVLDAYSSDAVPVHLLTTEAVELYLDRLAPGGVLAMHVSSRHLELEPVVASIARRLELAGLQRRDAELSPEQIDAEATPSHWIVLAREPASIEALRSADEWEPLTRADPDAAWTDDRSDLVGAISWWPDALR